MITAVCIIQCNLFSVGSAWSLHVLSGTVIIFARIWLMMYPWLFKSLGYIIGVRVVPCHSSVSTYKDLVYSTQDVNLFTQILSFFFGSSGLSWAICHFVSKSGYCFFLLPKPILYKIPCARLNAKAFSIALQVVTRCETAILLCWKYQNHVEMVLRTYTIYQGIYNSNAGMYVPYLWCHRQQLQPEPGGSIVVPYRQTFLVLLCPIFLNPQQCHQLQLLSFLHSALEMGRDDGERVVMTVRNVEL